MIEIVQSIQSSIEIAGKLREVSKKIGDADFKMYLADLSSALGDAKLEAANLKAELASLREENAVLRERVERREQSLFAFEHARRATEDVALQTALDAS